eukprot:gnl/Hemi2/15456_TR5198_c0_g1_i1.p1 gnl/Hemi2/15456_TR5198_c0_g1~~gnl/Hemi2/15456_TR5198_c0_g1_i1.p1  ORF type:complete len:417 (-),score=125.77 gnl/Hemi2/15456_TR5198_c0_g1_i1:76-1242(-)
MGKYLLVSLLCLALAVSAFGQRKRVLVLGLDGGKGPVVHEVMYGQGAAPNLLYLATVAGTSAMCPDPSAPDCAFAHDGNRFGSRPPAQESNYTSTYQWVTSPGWCSVVTGVDTYRHLVAGNDPWQQYYFTHTSKSYPTMFDYAKKANLTTAASGAPNFLSAFDPTSPYNQCNFGIVDYECGGSAFGPTLACNATSSCNLDFRLGLTEDGTQDLYTTEFAVERVLNGDADLIMTHYDLIDETGHEFGWGSPQQMKQISIVDNLIGTILEAVNISAALHNESWLVMVTADHGGHDQGHDKVWMEDEAVVFIAATINSATNVTTLHKPVRHFDVMPTVLAWFGLTPIGDIDGQVQVGGPVSWQRSRDARPADLPKFVPKWERRDQKQIKLQ